MGFLDKAKDKLTKAVDQHGDKIADGIDKAGKAVNDKTGGKHADKVNKAKKITEKPPTEPQFQDWIDQAKQLPVVLEGK